MAKLNIRLNPKSQETRPQQIAGQIAGAIESGKLSAGDTLPSERGLGEQLGVNRKTIRSAYQLLDRQKIIETMGTRGRRVRGSTGAKKGAQAAKKSAAGTSARAGSKSGGARR